jgi:general L-amino acid transport system permease protein
MVRSGKGSWRRLIPQALVLLVLLSLLFYCGRNLVLNFRRLGLDFGFGFLFDRPASFSIGDSPIPYDPSDLYIRAVAVGALNSLRVTLVGMVLAIVLGVAIGLGRLSGNWLARQLATVYVETFRNTPLLLQLFFWYFAIFLRLPPSGDPWRGLGGITLSNAGADLPGGLHLSSEFLTLTLALSAYTAAFIAETVRGGILSVDRGQWEAARALGLKPWTILRLIVFPQALRVIIPPLTNDCLNLAKNSSLAIAIGFTDVYAVSSTIANQTGRSVEMLLVVMATYLSFNSIVSLVMNRLERRVMIPRG